MRTVLFFLFVSSYIVSYSQNFYSWDGKILTLDNGVIKREINYSGANPSSTGLYLKGQNKNFLAKTVSPEFQFLVNDKKISEYAGGWEIESCEPLCDSLQGKGAKLKIKQKNIPSGIRLEINYLLYPNLPIARKWITFFNCSDQEMKIEALDIEQFNISSYFVETWLYTNYARMKYIGMNYIGNWDDPLIVVHDHASRSGIAFGNETPGVLKRIAYKNGSVEVGLTHPGQDYPFRKWLKPGEKWVSPRTFIALYANTDDGFNVVNTSVNDFVRKHMGTRISTIPKKPVFVFNSWNPFSFNVNEKLILELAKATSDCGVQEFVIDDGWQTTSHDNRSDAERKKSGLYGDWLIDMHKFPNGLKPVFDSIKTLGMKPGLWITLGTASKSAEVFIKHPEMFIRNEHGQIGTQLENDEKYKTACFGTGWKDYIKGAIVKLIKEHGLSYVKLDFPVVTSAYVSDPKHSWCYATDHPGHKDHEESFIALYENVLKLFDELHAAAPDLFIDCTFETTGKLQMMDYAFAQHADGNWLSNFYQNFPTGPLRVRQMAWWRSPVVPASSLVIGNLRMDGKNFDFNFKSLIGSLPIVLGDPRLIPEADRAKIKKWAGWLIKMQNKYNYMIFRRDLPGFGEPQEGAWDGWQRVNTDDRTGGIIGVFRQNSATATNTVTVTGLAPQRIYIVKQAVTGKKIAKMTGDELLNKGFRIQLKNKYDAEIFEVEGM
jgi:alpha-galactosidase